MDQASQRQIAFKHHKPTRFACICTTTNEKCDFKPIQNFQYETRRKLDSSTWKCKRSVPQLAKCATSSRINKTFHIIWICRILQNLYFTRFARMCTKDGKTRNFKPMHAELTSPLRIMYSQSPTDTGYTHVTSRRFAWFSTSRGPIQQEQTSSLHVMDIQGLAEIRFKHMKSIKSAWLPIRYRDISRIRITCNEKTESDRNCNHLTHLNFVRFAECVVHLNVFIWTKSAISSPSS